MRRVPSMRVLSCFLSALLLAMPFFAMADDAGVLTEGELNEWVIQMLKRSMLEEPQNAPVGEESHTQDGYAFLYSFATLYYDKPVIDESSVLKGFAVTDEGMDTPRGIRLGASSDALIAAYGWQNPELFGDGSLAALYMLDDLDASAYWAWAQLGAGGLALVRCAIHARVAEDRYTDAGIEYQVQEDMVTAIRVYGLDQQISLADVKSNLSSVYGVFAASSGDELPMDEGAQAITEGIFVTSDASAFGREDLRFAQIDFLTLKETGATIIFGPAQSDEWTQDDTEEWLHTTQRDGLSLTYVLDATKENSRLITFNVTKAGVLGPREVQVGDTLESVLRRFRIDGTGETFGYEALLYGDGQNAPYAALLTSGNASSLRYVQESEGADGVLREYSLHLLFEDGALTEMTLYTW